MNIVIKVIRKKKKIQGKYDSEIIPTKVDE